MLVHQLGVEDIAAGGQDHRFFGADKALLPNLTLNLGRFTTTSLRARGLIQAPLSHQFVELFMALGTGIACGQHRHLHTQNTACVLLAHQSLHTRLRQSTCALGQRRLFERRKKCSPRLPLGHHAVTTRCRLFCQRRVAVGRYHLIARVVEIHTIRRIRSFVRGHGGVKAGTLLFQPLQIGDAVTAEARQRGIAHHTVDLVFEVSGHGLGRVFKTRLLLIGRATTCIDHAARQHTGAAAAEAINDQYVRTLLACFDGRAGTCATPAHDDHVSGIRPLNIGRRAHIQRITNRVDGADVFSGTVCHISPFRRPCPATGGSPAAVACPACRLRRGRQKSWRGQGWSQHRHRQDP